MCPVESQRDEGKGPVALVTGAGRRVGNAIARVLASDGYRLALHVHDSLDAAEATARELIAGGTEAIVLAADLRDEIATRQMISTVRAHFGRIDALVNNAAAWISKPLELVKAADVRNHFELNALGTFICCQEVGLAMVAQATGGAIVNIGDWAIARPYVDFAAYFTAKGCIPTLTRTFAVEFGTRNPRVRVNAVLPGPVLLPVAMSPQDRRNVIEATLVKREGTPQDLAHAIRFLLENTFITGVCLPVDGGRSIYSPAPPTS